MNTFTRYLSPGLVHSLMPTDSVRKLHIHKHPFPHRIDQIEQSFWINSDHVTNLSSSSDYWTRSSEVVQSIGRHSKSLELDKIQHERLLEVEHPSLLPSVVSYGTSHDSKHKNSVYIKSKFQYFSFTFISIHESSCIQLQFTSEKERITYRKRISYIVSWINWEIREDRTICLNI